ncbi:MJ0042-type zinc finger domain-containing protein [Sphingomonas sp.]|uniref:MJ0042-type zinc finger domain-containing protein n=1 Tax=Sphingomonas sp. TaxID=28214 RepID=UPI003342CA34
MILECTECRTRYLVPDSSIGADGRTVRCASCKHSWFQAGVPMLDLVARAENLTVAPAPLAFPAEPTPAPLPPQIAPPGTYPEYDAFAHEPPFRPRRNPARRWTMAAVAAGTAMLAGVGGLAYSDAPGFARDLFRPVAPTPLKLVSKPVDRHTFNGNEIFAVSGSVLNPTDTRQAIPDIRADLRDAQKRIVFSWMIRPEAATLAPKAQIQFNSAKIDVPVNAQELVLSFSGEVAS